MLSPSLVSRPAPTTSSALSRLSNYQGPTLLEFAKIPSGREAPAGDFAFAQKTILGYARGVKDTLIIFAIILVFGFILATQYLY